MNYNKDAMDPVDEKDEDVKIVDEKENVLERSIEQQVVVIKDEVETVVKSSCGVLDSLRTLLESFRRFLPKPKVLTKTL